MYKFRTPLKYFTGYVQLILNEVMRLRSQYKTIKKAKVYAHDMLPAEPQSLVAQYLEGKERPSKEQVVASRKSRFSKPALPTSEKQRSQNKPCAKQKCNCRAVEVSCDSKCKCKVAKCINHE